DRPWPPRPRAVVFVGGVSVGCFPTCRAARRSFSGASSCGWPVARTGDGGAAGTFVVWRGAPVVSGGFPQLARMRRIASSRRGGVVFGFSALTLGRVVPNERQHQQ